MQLKLDFDASITVQFRTLKQCVAATVYGFRGGLGAVAKFIPDAESRRDAALATLESILPQMLALVNEVKGGK